MSSNKVSPAIAAILAKHLELAKADSGRDVHLPQDVLSADKPTLLAMIHTLVGEVVHLSGHSKI